MLPNFPWSLLIQREERLQKQLPRIEWKHADFIIEFACVKLFSNEKISTSFGTYRKFSLAHMGEGIWVKTPEVLARDRLLGYFSVKPVLSRLKNSLVVLATSLLVCVVVFVNIETGQKDSYIPSEAAGGRSIPGVYNDESARSFEPDAFCGGEPADP